VEADEGEMLTLGTDHPPRRHEHLSLFLTFSEPLLKAPNSKLRALEERVQGKSEGPLQTRFKLARGMNGKCFYDQERLI